MTFTSSGICTASTLSDDFASLTYTMAASASPSSTFDNVAFTFASRDFGVTVTLALASTWSANLPHGTVVSQSTTTVPGLARSASVWMFFGLPFSVTITSLFFAKFTGAPALRFAVTTLFMLAWSADANASAGAPCSICVSSSDDAPKLKSSLVPGFAVSNSLPRPVNALVSDDAANTVALPLSFEPVDVGVDDDLADEPHAATSSANDATTMVSFRDLRMEPPSPGLVGLRLATRDGRRG